MKAFDVHGLRHNAATLLLAEGIFLRNVSARLGYANVSTTGNIYAHALKSVDRLAAEKMDTLINNKNAGRLKPALSSLLPN